MSKLITAYNPELMKCRFCSEVSKQNALYTNGTLYPFYSGLMFEIKHVLFVCKYAVTTSTHTTSSNRFNTVNSSLPNYASIATDY